MEKPDLVEKKVIDSPSYRRFAADRFSLRLTDHLAQLTFSLDTVDGEERECTVREATALMTLKSLKVLQLLLAGIVTQTERELGAIPVDPQFEERMKSLIEGRTDVKRG